MKIISIMILILSNQADDDTNNVIKWLTKYKKEFIRINADEDNIHFMYFNIDDEQLVFDIRGKKINLFDFKSVWYRRQGFSFKTLNQGQKLIEKTIFFDGNSTSYTQECVKKEGNKLLNFIFYKLEQKKCLGSRFRTDLNKLQVLDTAKKYGLSTPESIIVTTKVQVLNFLLENQETVITKAIHEGIYRLTKNNGFFSYTAYISNPYCQIVKIKKGK